MFTSDMSYLQKQISGFTLQPFQEKDLIASLETGTEPDQPLLPMIGHFMVMMDSQLREQIMDTLDQDHIILEYTIGHPLDKHTFHSKFLVTEVSIFLANRKLTL